MTSRAEASVLWREGMFLYPQHLQAFSRELLARLQVSGALGLVGDYGLLSIDIDEEALATDTFRIASAKVLFRDGTLASFPDHADLQQREFSEHFEEAELDVFLGVPAAQLGVPQIGGGADSGRMHRYDVRQEDVPDENDREARRELEFRRLQGRLFFGDEDRSGFDTVLIARLARVGSPKTSSVLSTSFIPPVLCCGASSVLFEGLKGLLTKARGQARDLAARMPDVARLSSVEKGSDILGLLKLQAVNQCVSTLQPLVGQVTLHPYDAYLALVSAAGSLALFGEGRVLPETAPYEHDNLNECMGSALEVVDTLLAAEVAAPYDSMRFDPDATQPGLYHCALPAEWVDRRGIFHLAVEIAEEAETVRDMVASGVKLIAESDIERVLKGVMPGVGLRYERVPPLSFPKRNTLHYFAVETEGDGRDVWLGILQARDAVVLSALGGPDDVSFQFYVEFPD